MANFTLSENFGTYQGNTSYVLDGSTSQTWRCDSQASAGKYILVASDELIHVNKVTYYTGQSSEIFSSGTYLQISSDGNTFTDVGQFTGLQPLEFTVNADAKYIRIYCKSSGSYVSISELAIDYSDVSGGGGDITIPGGEKQTKSYTPARFDSDYSCYRATSSSASVGQGSTSASYSQFYLSQGSRATTYFSYSFDLSDIPANAIITSVKCHAKACTNGTTSSRVETRQVQMYSGSTAKGAPYNVSATTTPFEIQCGTWTRDELQNAKIRFYFVRGTSYTTTNYYVRFYGATLTVEYELPANGTRLRVKVDGKYHKVVKILHKENDIWLECSVEDISQDNYLVQVTD